MEALAERELPCGHLIQRTFQCSSFLICCGLRSESIVPTAKGRRHRQIINRKSISYVLLKNGAYLYDAQNNKLIPISPEDLRSQAADQRFADAPVQLIFVADLTKRGDSSEEGKLRMAYIDCGYISQNTYLFCTSEGLVTGARATVNRDALISKLKLSPEQRILLAHSVGHHKP